MEPRKSTLVVMGESIGNLHAGHFRITLSLGSQVLLWKILLQPHHKITTMIPEVSRTFYFVFLSVAWSIALVVLILLSLLYAIKCLIRFQTIKAEFMDHIGVNYLFTPWISWMLLIEAAPFVAPTTTAFVIFWWILAVPVVILDVKIYGEWFTKGKRYLTAVANPTSQMTVIGNLIGSRAAAKMRWTEVSLFLFSLGMAHYLVLFVTLYQRIPCGGVGEHLPAMLRPTFLLFFAAPSVASLAWYSISGTFDTASKMLFFLSLFLFASLVCRPKMFKKAMTRFNVAWWAYSFPITMLALASARYEEEVKGEFPLGVRLVLSGLSGVVLLALILVSVFNLRSLFVDRDPNITDDIRNMI